ncbi:hypothetical protein B5807_01105 [Epicoccum nigrum]|uniref:Uncharacterized protein n=1 Tax=Epicoccum nigrum TaxID=105696 RepID=A0A1Y2MG12_EPING|nr:hypothetical protein B5807_01105 [Epicoccum nigrum]
MSDYHNHKPNRHIKTMPFTAKTSKKQNALVSFVSRAKGYGEAIGQVYTTYYSDKPVTSVPESTTTDAVNSAAPSYNTLPPYSASQKLQQVLGMRSPQPLVAPPVMPHDLMGKFEAVTSGRRKHTGSLHASKQAGRSVDSSSTGHGKPNLDDIVEEEESPVKTATDKSKEMETSVSQHIFNSLGLASRFTLLDSDNSGIIDNTDKHPDPDTVDCDYDRYFESGATIVANDDSGTISTGPAYNASPNMERDESLPVFPPFDVETQARDSKESSDSSRSRSYKPVTNILSYLAASSAPYVPRVPIQEPVPVKAPGSKKQPSSTSTRREHSTDVEERSRGSGESKHKPRRTRSGRGRSYKPVTSVLGYLAASSAPYVPRVTVQEPTPVKEATPVKEPAPMNESTPVNESNSMEESTPVETPTSKKRPHSPSTQDEFGLRQSRRARRDANTGLPILSSTDEARWKEDFPGNTTALLTVLLTWSHTIWTLHQRIPNPKLLSTHPVFPYPITPPVAKNLLSASFYDTSIEPHRELRFLGPGDVAELSYHEVDVFRSHRREESSQVALHPPFAAGVLIAMQASAHSRYTTMAQRARTGEGRWCYVLAKGHAPADGATAPHLVLAWHISCVTATSNSLRTLYPDDDRASPLPTAPVAQDHHHHKLRRRSSMQDLGSPTQANWKKTLRATSSTSALPRFDPSAPVEGEGEGEGEVPAKREGGVTLQRTVLRMGKVGRIPLVEGFRVDVDAFQGWMEACGTGDGKVILWRE